MHLFLSHSFVNQYSIYDYVTLKRRGEFVPSIATTKQEFATLIDIYKFI